MTEPTKPTCPTCASRDKGRREAGCVGFPHPWHDKPPETKPTGLTDEAHAACPLHEGSYTGQQCEAPHGSHLGECDGLHNNIDALGDEALRLAKLQEDYISLAKQEGARVARLEQENKRLAAEVERLRQELIITATAVRHDR